MTVSIFSDKHSFIRARSNDRGGLEIEGEVRGYEWALTLEASEVEKLQRVIGGDNDVPRALADHFAEVQEYPFMSQWLDGLGVTYSLWTWISSEALEDW